MPYNPEMPNDARMTDLADPSQIDEISAYALKCSYELISQSTLELLQNDPFAEITPNAIARSISADRLESSSFSNLPCDPELLHFAIESMICAILSCRNSDICADF